MTKHYKYSPSKMHRIIKCHGSAGAEDMQDAGEAAEIGTAMHDLAARALNGEALPADLDHDQKRSIETYVNFVREWQEQLAPCELKVEDTLVSHRVRDFGGTADTLIISEDTLCVIDFKTGRVPVSSYDNYQLMSYLTLAREKYPHAKNFLAAIVQPVVSREPEMATYTNGELLDFSLELFDALGSEKMEAGTHCKYCPLLPKCETARLYTLECAAFAPINDSEELSVEECLRIIDTMVVIQSLEGHAKRAMFARLMRGEPVPGWRLGKSMGHRKFPNEGQTMAALKAAGVKRKSYMVEKLASPAQLEKLPGREGIKARKVVDEMAIREENGVIVCEERSRVPRYNPADIFEEITDVDDSSREDASVDL